MADTSNLDKWFGPLFGQRPWRARLGWGSFLTFDFGPRVRDNGHQHGTWHLWIKDSEWSAKVGTRVAFHSESPRHVLEVGARSLEKEALTGVTFDSQREVTTFRFGDRLRLIVQPYSDRQDCDDRYWLLFMPEHNVITVGPKQPPRLARADAPLAPVQR